MRPLPRRMQIFTVAATVTAATSCSLPVAHDANDGFAIGVPSGWNLSTLGGTVVATKNNLEQSIVYPVVMTKGLKSPHSLARTWATYRSPSTQAAIRSHTL